MTPAEEARFIELWSQGASYRELAAALGCPLGTVASRSAALAAQGKLSLASVGVPRPGREAHPHQSRDQCRASTPVQCRRSARRLSS
jgi:hypothetical protein